MATEFAMPKLGLTMESGTILAWLVPNGTPVDAGDAVLLVETDKVETEIEASGSGELHHSGEVGEEYACGVRIGWFCEPGEAPPAATSTHPATDGSAPAAAQSPEAQSAATASVQATAAPARAPGERVLASPAAKRLARELGLELAAIAGSGPKGRITERDVTAAAASTTPESTTAGATSADSTIAGSTAEASASPGSSRPAEQGVPPPATFAARQFADLLGVDLHTVRAGSTDGRISRADVAAHVRSLLASLSATPTTSSAEPNSATHEANSAPAKEAPPLTQTPTELIPLRGMRGVIAQRMSESLQSMAQLTLTMDVDMSAVITERSTQAAAPGYTDYMVAAAAAALRTHQRVNSQVTADAVALLPDIHVGLAVALDDGLLVPVIRHADRLSLAEIAAETQRLASGAREGTLSYDDYQGATFTVTALGMFGVDAFTPIINSPNTAILGVGRIRNATDWSADNAPVAKPVLTLSLTWDHRAFDGAPAAHFTAEIRNWLESR